MNIKLSRSSGYDPALGKSHSDNQDQTLQDVVDIKITQKDIADLEKANDVCENEGVGPDLGHLIARMKAAIGIRAKIESVLEQNEARCLDDDIDRGVVVRELLKAPAP